jgi:hypothetical protein
MRMSLQPNWPEVTVYRSSLGFPNLCPACVQKRPASLVRIASERSRMTAFYLFGARHQVLYVRIPFCFECASRRDTWATIDGILLVVSAILAMVLGFGIAGVLNLATWIGFLLFGIFATAFTFLCSLSMVSRRAVRVLRFDDSTVTFAFKQLSYADGFRALNKEIEKAN